MPRLAALGLLLLVPVLIWGPAEVTGRVATSKADALGRHCWALRNPNGTMEMILTLDPAAPYRFWINERDRHSDVARPHFAVVLPDADHDAYALGWSHWRRTFWRMDSRLAEALGLAFAQEDCRTLLAPGRTTRAPTP